MINVWDENCGSPDLNITWGNQVSKYHVDPVIFMFFIVVKFYLDLKIKSKI